jgi:hypothetical protein
MGWLRDRVGRFSGRPKDVAERLTTRGLFRVVRESAALSERETVQDELHQARDQQVAIFRSWGTVVAVADARHPVTVFLSDADKSWFAVPPEVSDDGDLTPDQVEHVLLDALTASSPPTWPEWRYLV